VYSNAARSSAAAVTEEFHPGFRNSWKRRSRIRAGCATCGVHCRDGRRFRKLDAAVQRDIHELFTRSAGA
jgi:hypothetical protein